MITFKELLERARSERTAIHTPTEEQAKALLNELNKKGYKWASGKKLTDATYYEYDKKNTCYCFGIDADGDLLNKKVVWDSLKFHQENGYTIIKFSDIDFAEDTLENID